MSPLKYKFGEISPKLSKVWPTKELFLITTKSGAKFKVKLTCSIKYNNLVNFQSAFQKPKNFTLMGSFYPKYIRFELKKYRGVIFHGNGQWCKI